MSTIPLHSAVDAALRYPLMDALVNRRSRRFSLGAALPGGALAYQSKAEPKPLDLAEEALLAFAAAGVNGMALGDLPYREGDLHEGGGGNVIAALTGRTGASADAVHAAALFVINDEATYLLRRPQDFTLAEIAELARLAADRDFAAAYERMRIKIRDGRTAIEKRVPLTFPFNKWSTNLPGSTYFLPVSELTGMYINVLFSCFDEQMALYILDERNRFKPAGIKRFGKSQGGRLNDDPDGDRVISVLALETVMVEFMLAEQAFMVHNLSLMEQAMGLGGWTHFATATETAWFEALGFRLGSQRLSQVMNAGPLLRGLLRLTNMDRLLPHALGLTIDGADLIRPFCPPHYPSMREAVLAFLELKREGVMRARVGAVPGAWKDPQEVQANIPDFSEPCIEAVIAYCEYIYQRYGRFPAHFGPLRTTLAHQAHHLDLEFYDRFYTPGAYTATQRDHDDAWHATPAATTVAGRSPAA
jgi:hypothetical protein